MAREFQTQITLPSDPTTSLQAATKQYVDTGLSGKQAAGAAAGGVLTGTYPNPGLAPVPTAPRTDSASSTYTADATVAGDIQLTCTGNTTITPSGTPNGRMMIVECLASGGARTPSVATSVVLPKSGGPSSRSLTLASGDIGVFGLRYSALDSAWWLMSAEVF